MPIDEIGFETQNNKTKGVCVMTVTNQRLRQLSFFQKFGTGSKVCLIALMSLASTQLLAAEPKQAFHLNPEFEQQYGFSIAVKAGGFLHIGGVTAVDEEGNEVYANDANKQMQLIYERLGAILAAHDADFSSVVSETIYYKTDNETYIKALDVRTAAYKGVVAPSAAGVKVADFVSDKTLIEITAVAYLGE
ncbi:RidA family protein [Stutzerimonas nitrititolerans]|uniref:RidA family protein n=1 Tax=Stutzerimonas TaxID=2901164 RepID=UPI00210AD0F2|nr:MULTISPECIES: RidA family protein [Stutzerimonas]MCQ4310080.1 RidA family protein [Stutzerimonas stutzeri]